MHIVAQAADNGTIGQCRAIALVFDRPQAGAESTCSGIEIDTQPRRFKRPCRWMQVAIAINQQRAAVDHQFILATNPVEVGDGRSEEHTSELQSLMRISYAVFCLKKKNT